MRLRGEPLLFVALFLALLSLGGEAAGRGAEGRKSPFTRPAAAAAAANVAAQQANKPAGQQQYLADYVDTRIGSGSSGAVGNTFPATGVPFANTFITPQTQAGENKCIAPYYDWDTAISGFRASHWVSGSCMKDYGSLTLMPLAFADNQVSFNLTEDSYASPFRKETEFSSPYRYSVTLDRYNVEAAATAVSHASVLQFIYTNASLSESFVLLKPNGMYGEGEISFDRGAGLATVRSPVHRLYAGAGLYAGFDSHYAIQFYPEAVLDCVAVNGTQVIPGACSITAAGAPIALYLRLRLDVLTNSTLEVFIGHSFTNASQALNNLNLDLGSSGLLCFSAVQSFVRDAWQDALSSIVVEGATQENMTTFYTALYHSLLHPRVHSDLSYDNAHIMFSSNATHNPTVTEAAPYYDDYSMWDIYRVTLPLISIIQPDRYTAFMRSIVSKARQGGWLPIFPCWNSYTNEMVGDHAITILADGIAKGLFPETDGYTWKEVFEAGWKNAMQTPSPWEQQNGSGRRALAAYQQYGYIPLDADTGKDQQVSISLEYAYDDHALGVLATRLNQTKEAQALLTRAQNWRLLMTNASDTDGQWYARGRWANGSFVTPFDPFAGAPGHGKPPSYITEDSAFEYTWFAPHALPQLVALFGGPTAFVEKLAFFFAGNGSAGTQGGFYNAGNEPDIQVPFLFSYGGAPWLTQRWVANLTRQWYRPTPDGLPGNDDAGAMSSWYVFATVGFYPVCLGGSVESPTPKYVIGAPQFPSVTLTVGPGGKTLTVVAKGVSAANAYIQSATLNGNEFTRGWISHDEVAAGGELAFVMGPQPNLAWGTGPDDIPTVC